MSNGKTIEMDKAVRDAVADGWYEVPPAKGRGGHRQLRHPKGGIVVAARSPSDHRAIMNFKSNLRRAARQWTQEG